MDGTLGATLGTGATAGALFLTPDEFVTPNPTRGIQPLFRVLHCYRMAKQVSYGYRQAFSDADAKPFKLQLYPILT